MTKTTIKRVLVAVKPSQTGLPLAADHARMLAEQLGAELVLLRIVYGSGGGAAGREHVLGSAREDLEKLAELVREWGVTVHVDVRTGAPVYDAIVDAVRELRGDLLVVGAHTPRPLPHTRLTDTDWQLMRLCPCPLLLVKDPEFQGYGTVMAAVDPLYGHEEPAGTDRAVLGQAALFAKAMDGQLRVVHAYPDPEQYNWVSAVEVEPGVFYGSENIETVHRQAVQELVDGYGVPPDRIDLGPGDPRLVVPQLAAERNAKLLVVGVLKRSALGQAMLGSTAEYIVDDAPCDVLMVKPG